MMVLCPHGTLVESIKDCAQCAVSPPRYTLEPHDAGQGQKAEEVH